MCTHVAPLVTNAGIFHLLLSLLVGLCGGCCPVDDTDNNESHGTGFRAREIGRLLQENGIAKLTGGTRHQLLFDRRIPYTSHNSAACIEVESNSDKALSILRQPTCSAKALMARMPGYVWPPKKTFQK
jgi:hypothetical protein